MCRMSESDFNPYVQWTGEPAYNEITAQEWQANGVEGQATVAWTPTCSMISMNHFNQAALDWMSGQPNYVLVYEPPVLEE